MSAADIWMPLYVPDFLTATTHLSTEETGAYLLVLMGAWTRGGKVPDDEKQLARIAKTDLDTWRRISPVLKPFFTVEGGFWIQCRLLHEKEKAIRNCEKRQAVGKLGGRPKSQTNRITNRLSNSLPIGEANQNPFTSTISTNSPPTPQRGGQGADLPEVNFPTLQEITAYGATLNVVPEVCKSFFDHYQGNNLWANRFGRLIDWKHKLPLWNQNERAKTSAGGPGGTVSIGQAIRLLEEEISKHRANPNSVFHSREATELERADLQGKKRKLKELKAKAIQNV